jgi:hypothetical protein
MNIGHFRIADECRRRVDQHLQESDGRVVAILSHTAYAEGHVGLCFFMQHREWPVRAFMARNKWVMFERPLRRLGIMIRNREEHNNTDSIIRQLKNESEFMFLLALADDRGRQRSGYFHIARQTGARIIVIGFDFWRRCGYVSQKSWSPAEDADFETWQPRYEPEILAELGKIYPLNPEKQIGFDRDLYFRHYPSLDPNHCPFPPYHPREVIGFCIKTYPGWIVGIVSLLVVMTVSVVVMIRRGMMRWSIMKI